MTNVDGFDKLLIVDDDQVFSQVLSRSLSRRGWHVHIAHDEMAVLHKLSHIRFGYAVLDLKLAQGSGLHLIAVLRAANPLMKIVVLTGYASIATAVEAIKLGATHYLAKPANSDEIVHALNNHEGDAAVSLSTTPLSIDRLEWEHIQTVLTAHHNNISATARALNMHRRTLQRKLAKKPVRS